MPRRLALVSLLAAACATTGEREIVQVRGKLRYERREVRADLSGLGAPELAGAPGVPFVVRADGRVLAQGVTGDGGTYSARVPAPLPPHAKVTFSTVVHDRRGRPR